MIGSPSARFEQANQREKLRAPNGQREKHLGRRASDVSACAWWLGREHYEIVMFCCKEMAKSQRIGRNKSGVVLGRSWEYERLALLAVDLVNIS